MSRRIGTLVTVGCLTLALRSVATAQQPPEDLRRLKDDIHREMSTCVSYFRIVAMCLSQGWDFKQAAADNDKHSEDLNDKAGKLAQEIGISPEAAGRRMFIAGEEMMKLVKRNCENLSSLIKGTSTSVRWLLLSTETP